MVAITVLSGMGIVLSLFFALIHYNVMPADSRYLPSVCRMESGSCAALLSTRDARLFGIPNFFPGLVYYAAVFLFSLNTTLQSHFSEIIIGLSGITVLVSLYLSSSLLFKLRVVCVPCFAGHAINLLIFLLLVVP